VCGRVQYHIFYQLCAGASSDLKKALSLDAPHTFEYLKQSGCTTIDGVNDGEDFSNTGGSLSRLGFSEEEVSCVCVLVLC
jgi:myosin heavy subunit